MGIPQSRGIRFGAAERLNMLPLALYILVVSLAFAWPYLAADDSQTPYSLPTAKMKLPTPAHPLGLDDLGGDVLANVFFGFKTSFVSGLLATMLFLVFGIGIGLAAGFEEKAGAGIIGAVANGLNSVPKFFALFLAFIVIGGYEPFLLMALLGVLSAPRLSEMLRFKISQYRKEDFYDAAIALGLSRARVVGKHIIWYNARRSIFSEMAYMFGYAILSEATLSFILHGARKPGWQSWGDIISHELSGFSMMVYDLFNRTSRETTSATPDNPLKFLAPLAALVFTVMLFTILSRRLGQEPA